MKSGKHRAFRSGILKMKEMIFAVILFFFIVSCTDKMKEMPGHTLITTWKDNKKAAVSITYDDGTINQFIVARPIMNRLGLPGTFFINTGKVEGSGEGKFIGRPENEIIRESASVRTNEDNFFERASLIRFTGIDKAVDYHTRAGSLYESGKIREAYELMDEAYTLVRRRELKKVSMVVNTKLTEATTWEDLKIYAAEGHEIASHTITHPKLAVLDEVNLLYELEQSKADIKKYLGEKHTFSAECPYGTENERVMKYALKIYPATRNHMPDFYLDELNRGSKRQPGESVKEYVQWQRGVITSTKMEIMKSWVDTCLAHDNIWLVLVFHGIEGIGYEAIPEAVIEDYFNYIKNNEPSLWTATFGDVTKYMRERKNSTLNYRRVNNTITVNVSSDLDHGIYDVPLTLKTYVPEKWKSEVDITTRGKGEKLTVPVQKDERGSFVLYDFIPGEGEKILTRHTGI